MRFWLRTWLLTTAFVCAGAAAADIKSIARQNDDAIYGLSLSMTDQLGRTQPLNLYRGHPVVVTMFYASCPNVCPLLIETLRATENALKPDLRDDVRVLLITIDPKRDTSAALATLAKTRHIDSARWTLARVDAADVRVLAATLGVQYRQLPNGEFNHTSVLTLLSREGVIRAQTSMLGRVDPAFVSAMEAAAQERSR